VKNTVELEARALVDKLIKGEDSTKELNEKLRTAPIAVRLALSALLLALSVPFLASHPG